MAQTISAEEFNGRVDLARRLMEAGKLDEAIKECSELLNEDPNSAVVLFLAGTTLMKADRYGMAYQMLKRCIELLPGQDVTWNNFGMAAMGCNNHAEAMRAFDKAIKICHKKGEKPAASYGNYALCELNECNPNEAIRWAEMGLAIDPNEKNFRETLGYAQLMKGDFANGFKNAEAALGGKFRKWVTYRGEPYWNGEPVKTLIVRGEQGLGDEVCFASVLPDAAKDMQIILECDHRLEGLFRRSFDFPIYPTRHQKNEITWPLDYQPDASCLTGSLCQYYRKSAEDFPGAPYLVADPERRVQWRALLDSLGPKPKVGIAWKGGAKHAFRHRRSLRLEELLPILRQDCEFVCLEYDDPTSELAALQEKHGIYVHYWPRAVKKGCDVDETAALLSELDLVITVTTATSHLCGALGVPAWVLVPNKPRWFYGLTGDRLPWYESVKMYRQTKEWAGVINKIAQDLRDSDLLRARSEGSGRERGIPALGDAPSVAPRQLYPSASAAAAL